MDDTGSQLCSEKLLLFNPATVLKMRSRSQWDSRTSHRHREEVCSCCAWELNTSLHWMCWTCKPPHRSLHWHDTGTTSWALSAGNRRTEEHIDENFLYTFYILRGVSSFTTANQLIFVIYSKIMWSAVLQNLFNTNPFYF